MSNFSFKNIDMLVFSLDFVWVVDAKQLKCSTFSRTAGNQSDS